MSRDEAIIIKDTISVPQNLKNKRLRLESEIITIDEGLEIADKEGLLQLPTDAVIRDLDLLKLRCYYSKKHILLL